MLDCLIPRLNGGLRSDDHGRLGAGQNNMELCAKTFFFSAGELCAWRHGEVLSLSRIFILLDGLQKSYEEVISPVYGRPVPNWNGTMR